MAGPFHYVTRSPGLLIEIDLSRIPLQCVRTVVPERDWGTSYHTFTVFLSTLTTVFMPCAKHYGRLRSSPVHLHSGFRVLYWLPRSPSLKESIKPWDLTAVGLFLLSPTAVKLQGGYHQGATSTLCGRNFYYIQKGIPALPARTLSRWLGDPSKGASPPVWYLPLGAKT